MVGWVFVGAGDHGGSRNLKGGTRTTYNHGPVHVCAESLIQTTVVLANQEFINLSKMMWGAANHDCLFFAVSLLFFICLYITHKDIDTLCYQNTYSNLIAREINILV